MTTKQMTTMAVILSMALTGGVAGAETPPQEDDRVPRVQVVNKMKPRELRWTGLLTVAERKQPRSLLKVEMARLERMPHDKMLAKSTTDQAADEKNVSDQAPVEDKVFDRAIDELQGEDAKHVSDSAADEKKVADQS